MWLFKGLHLNKILQMKVIHSQLKLAFIDSYTLEKKKTFEKRA